MKCLFKNNKIRFILVLFLTAFSLTFVTKFYKHFLPVTKNTTALANYQSPQIYIYGGEGGFSSAGLITLASTDEPTIQIGGYNISGSAEITMYKADLSSVLNYLTHDKDNKQTKGSPDVNSFQYVATTQHDINTSSYAGSKINLPFSETGIWYLKVKIGSITADAFVLRSNFGVLAKKGDGEFILWGQDFKTKRSITNGSVQILNLKDNQKIIQTTNFDSSGIAHANLSQDADIAIAQLGEDIAIVPLNLMYLNSGASFSPFTIPDKQTKYFTFTDRPLYKPGDTVYFKSVFRDDDDARYSIPTGVAEVKVYFGWDDQNSLSTSNITISKDGTINGEYKIPENSKVGNYTLSVKAGSQYTNSTTFDVEYYQKPESYIDVSTSKTELIAGDKSTFKISGSYFSGQPLVGQKIKYKVTSSDFYEYQYLNDAQDLAQNLDSNYQYSYWDGSHTVIEDEATLDDNGEANINLNTKMDFNQGKTQVFSIEATLEDGSQTPSFSRRNILVYAGEFGIFRADNSYGGKINTKLDLPISLYSYYPSTKLSGIDLTAKVHRTNWVEYQDPTQKYPSYKKEEEDLSNISATTDSKGNADINFVPTKLGLYTFTVQGNDSRGNLVSKVFYEYVTQNDQPAYTDQGGDQLTISTDKQKYNSTDTAHISIYSAIPDRDIFLSFERGRMDRFQIVHLSGKNGVADVPLVSSDIPNMFAKIESFSDSELDSNIKDISVSSTVKKVIVDITPNSKKYGPGDNVNLDISTKDINGSPVSSDVAVWAVDKAIFELSDSTLGNIFNTFWDERYDNTQEAHSLEGIVVNQAEMGGCFVTGTKVLMSNGTLKNIENIKIGDFVSTRESPESTKLVKAKVIGFQKAEDNGYLIINNTLKITPDHILWVNGSWAEASSIQPGDKLTDEHGNSVYINSIEWQSGKSKVYNLNIEKYHTFFADGIWVHNDKGSTRSTLKDTAYWNPSVHTNSLGKAQISFKLPDNLTTWTLAAVADTSDTKVGQATTEIVVSKDIIVRPILPNILRQGDKAIISALTQNFSDTDHKFNVKLAFDSGNIASPDFMDTPIKSNSLERFFWEIDPKNENTNAKLTFSATATDKQDLSDSIVQEIPIKPFEFEEKNGKSSSGNQSFNIKLSSDINKDKTKITLSLSPTILGTLPSAMRYLVNYPYGCNEQITSSLSSSLIAKSNQTFFADATKGKDLDDIINKGIAKLEGQQQSNGGWTWWFTGQSNLFITTYILDNLTFAKSLGYKVDQSIFDSARSYLESSIFYDNSTQASREYTDEEWITKDYGLALLGGSQKAKKIDNFYYFTPDMLSMLVMENYLNGDKNADTNGLNTLVSLAHKQGDSLYWDEGTKLNFGSKDASTALAIRAIVLAKGDLNIARQGALYLIRNRQYDYWSNTFATSQVVRAILNLSNAQNELSPDFSYTVDVDGSNLFSGAISQVNQKIEDINIPLEKIKANGSEVKVNINGQGNIYSTILIDEFHTDKNAKSQNNGLSIKREYINEKGSQYTLSPGDSVTVKLTVDGPMASENYAVIADELPSGMVPINANFNNEQYGQDSKTSYFSSPDVIGMDITQNGAILSLDQLTPGQHVYTYRARIVSAGTFSIPPATISLMYAPEINGHSDAQSITIDKVSKIIPSVVIKEFTTKHSSLIIVVAIIIIILTFGIIYFKKKNLFQKINNWFQKTFRKIKDSISKDIPPSPPTQ
jgi:uncharacterized protein YfaS (alpha-2-macroglobulin family)